MKGTGRIIILIFALSALVSQTGWSAIDPSSVQTTLSTNTVFVGDRVILTVTAAHDADQRVVLEPIQYEPFITVWDAQTKTVETKTDKMSTTHTVTFSSFVIGQHQVSTNRIIFLGPDGAEQAVPFPDLLINVVSILSNPPPALADIRPAAPLPGHPWLRVFWIFLLIIVVAIIAAWLIRRWLNKPKAPPSARIIPPYEVALSALQSLLSRGYIENKDAQPFYVELSAIVRIYLEDRFNLQAPEQTTEEFIRSSSQSAVLSPDHRMLTQAFLEQSDLVKFARFEPSPEDMQAAWDAAARLVRETIPAPSPVKTGGGAP